MLKGCVINRFIVLRKERSSYAPWRVYTRNEFFEIVIFKKLIFFKNREIRKIQFGCFLTKHQRKNISPMMNHFSQGQKKYLSKF